MCDASDFDAGVVLGQHIDKKLNVIHHANKNLDSAQKNYATTEKELLAVVIACDKFRPYILHSQVTIHTNHAAIKYLMEKNNAKPTLLNGFFCYKNSILTLSIGKGVDNPVADHLSIMENVLYGPIHVNENFPDEQLAFIKVISRDNPWYANYTNLLSLSFAS